MNDETPVIVIRPAPLVRGFYALLLLCVAAWMVGACLSYYGRDAYVHCTASVLVVASAVLFLLHVMTLKITLGADSIALHSWVLPLRRLLKNDIQSQHDYTRGPEVRTVILTPVDSARKKMRIDLTILTAGAEKSIRDFLRGIPDVPHGKNNGLAVGVDGIG